MDIFWTIVKIIWAIIMICIGVKYLIHAERILDKRAKKMQRGSKCLLIRRVDELSLRRLQEDRGMWLVSTKMIGLMSLIIGILILVSL